MKHHCLFFCVFLLPTLSWTQTPALPRYEAAAVIQLPPGAAPSDLTIADFDRDNRPDFAVSERGLNCGGSVPAVRHWAHCLPPAGRFLRRRGRAQQLGGLQIRPSGFTR